MKITLSRAALLQAVQYCQSIVEKRHTIPILANLLLEAKDDSLSMTATDTEVSIRHQTTALVEETGSITISAHKLFDIIKELDPEQDVSLETADAFVVIRSGRSRFRVASLAADQYPGISEDSNESFISLSSDVLCDMISATSFAMSTDETRKYLTGTLFEIDAQQILRLVTTDGHRLALSEINLAQSAEEKSCIVPKKAVIELSKLCGACEEAIELSFSERQIRVKAGANLLVSKLIDARFPVYQDVIPVDNPYKISVERTFFDQVLRRNMVVANEFTHDIRLVFANNSIDISAHNTEQEESEEHIAVEYDGPDISVGFNGKYLRDTLSAIRTASVSIDLRDELSPILISGEGQQQSRYVIMPMRI